MRTYYYILTGKCKNIFSKQLFLFCLYNFLTRVLVLSVTRTIFCTVKLYANSIVTSCLQLLQKKRNIHYIMRKNGRRDVKFSLKLRV